MATETKDYRDYLDPQILSTISGLDLRARNIVEGYIAGLHKSPFRGFSAEFAQHRDYNPGDDIRHIDWKVFAKSDRYCIKEFEEETNLKCHLMIDISESMRYAGQGMSKLDYAATAAGALAYLQLGQKDSVGMTFFDDEVRLHMPPSNKPSYLRNILNEVAQVKPAEKTNVAPLFHRMAEEYKRRRMVVIFSDMFVNRASAAATESHMDEVFEALKHFRFNRHEVLLFHILDEDELTFPFQRSTLFKGMEMLPELLTEPRSLRRAYLDSLGRFLKSVEKKCREVGVDYLRLSTADRLDVVLSRFLAARGAKSR